MDRATLTQATVDRIAACGGPTAFEHFVAGAAARVVEPREIVDASLSLPSIEPDH